MPTSGATDTPAAPVRLVTLDTDTPAADPDAEADATGAPLWIVTELGSWPLIKLAPHVLDTADEADDAADALAFWARGASSVSAMRQKVDSALSDA